MILNIVLEGHFVKQKAFKGDVFVWCIHDWWHDISV